MKESEQDATYRRPGGEGDAFFERNRPQGEVPPLRPHKATIVARLARSGIRPDAVLEYGCNYGDMLHHFLEMWPGVECYGIEASPRAVAFGRDLYGERVKLVDGTIADNPLAGDPCYTTYFDLVIVDDVFCWISRETLYQSVANIDDAVSDGGFLFIRDFYPDARVRNPNHHVPEGSVHCHKVPGSHAGLFTASGIYEIVQQDIYLDTTEMSANYQSNRPFESRWADTLLRKSYAGHFERGPR